MLLLLPIVYQLFASQPCPFYYNGHIVLATKCSDLLYQCFMNHYQSDPVLYITIFPMITNKLPIHIITNHRIGNFLPIGSQCFTNHHLPVALENLPIAANGLPLVPIDNDIQVKGLCKKIIDMPLNIKGSSTNNFCHV